MTTNPAPAPDTASKVDRTLPEHIVQISQEEQNRMAALAKIAFLLEVLLNGLYIRLKNAKELPWHRAKSAELFGLYGKTSTFPGLLFSEARASERVDLKVIAVRAALAARLKPLADELKKRPEAKFRRWAAEINAIIAAPAENDLPVFGSNTQWTADGGDFV